MRNTSISVFAIVAAIGFTSPSAAQLGGLVGDGGLISTNDGGGLVDLDIESDNGLGVDLDVGGQNGIDTDVNIGGSGQVVDVNVNAGGSGGLDVGATIGTGNGGLDADANVDLGGSGGLNADVSADLDSSGLDTDVGLGLGGSNGLGADVSVDLGSGGLDADVDIGLGGLGIGADVDLGGGGGGGSGSGNDGGGGGGNGGNNGPGGGNGGSGNGATGPSGLPIIIVQDTNGDDQNIRIRDRSSGSGVALTNTRCSRPDDRTGVAVVNSARYGSSTLSAWQNAAAVQVISLNLCPQVRNEIASSLANSGTANWLESAIARTPALRAGLNSTSHGADDVMAIDQQGGTLRIFVY